MDALVLILTIFSAFVLGAAGSYIMETKGRSQGLGFALSFFLGALGLLIVLGLENHLRRKSSQVDHHSRRELPKLDLTSTRYPNEDLKIHPYV